MNLKLPNYLARNGWRPWHVVAGFGLMGLGVAATWEAWSEIFTMATMDEEHSHVLLAPIVFIWLFWVRKARLRYCRPQRSFIGPALVLLGAVLSVVGARYAYYQMWHAGALCVVVGCCLTVFGKDLLLKFFPAFVVLVFMIPSSTWMRQPIAQPMQLYTASVTQGIFEIMHVDVQRSENLLVINGKEVAVAEACNGMRMVFTLVMVSFVIAFGTPLRGAVRFLILAGALPIALVCNIIRMVPTVWMFGLSEDSSLMVRFFLWVHDTLKDMGVIAGYDKSQQPAASIFHDIAGWIMIFVAFLVLLGIIGILRWAMVPIRNYNLAYD